MADLVPNETQVIKRVLPVKLTEEERLQRADGLANALQQVQDRKIEKRAAVREADKMIAEAEQEAVELRDAVATGREYQEVIVHKVYDYEKATVTEVRTDTGETIKSRGMTDEERQAKLLDDSDAAGN
jgi:hypothetical protein